MPTDPRTPQEATQAEGKYLGDGAYVRIEGEFIVVYTHNGYHPTNSVYLEPEVARELKNYLNEVVK